MDNSLLPELKGMIVICAMPVFIYLKVFMSKVPEELDLPMIIKS